jgi:uracil-DNA glycosylase family 4
VAIQDHDELIDLLNQSRQALLRQESLFGELIMNKPATTGGAAPQGTAASAVALANRPGPPAGGAPFFDYPDEPWAKAKNLAGLNAAICDCVKCALGTTRTKFVFGVGNPKAEVMFIGEGPGADEDAKGEPFVGRAGKLLDKIIEATGMKRQEVYICNIVKCRPPNNRPPLPAEEETCTPYLMKQIELVKPKFIICLGRTAAQWILKTTDGLAAMRGKMHDFHGSKLIVTYHPAALLRNPEWKKPTWEDMKMLMKALEESRG